MWACGCHCDGDKADKKKRKGVECDDDGNRVDCICEGRHGTQDMDDICGGGVRNDAIANDIMHLKRNIIDVLLHKGIRKFLFVAENVLSFYADDESYYEEWHEELEENGWVVVMNLPDQSMEEFMNSRVRDYLFFEHIENWRTYQPHALFELIDNKQIRRLD